MNTAPATTSNDETAQVPDGTLIFHGAMEDMLLLVPFILTKFPGTLLHVYRAKKDDENLVRIRSFPCHKLKDATEEQTRLFLEERRQKNVQIKLACDEFLVRI